MNVQNTSTSATGDASELPTNKVVRLMRELSEALEVAFGDQFHAMVGIGGYIWLENADNAPALPPDKAFESAAASLKVAAMVMDPTVTGLWAGWGLERENQIEHITFDRGSKAHARALALRGAK
jgi:hypothetical protein